MMLPEAIKGEIQFFVYFLFKGTLDPRLIAAEFGYLDKLLNDPDLLYNCFEIFAYSAQKENIESARKIVADYILALHQECSNKNLKLADLAKEFNSTINTFWSDFLILARWFCYNSFPEPLCEADLKDLFGWGGGAVPTFATWTNVIKIDKNLKVKNSDAALKRANDRIKVWGMEASVAFEEWELEQEIY